MHNSNVVEDANSGPACSLDAGSLADRRESWRVLDRHALSRLHEPGERHTTYPNRPELVQELHRLVQAERQCCPFLDLSVIDEGATVRLRLRYPDGFEQALASFLDPGTDGA